MPKTKKRKKAIVDAVYRAAPKNNNAIPRLNFSKMSQKQIKKFIYDNKLGELVEKNNKKLVMYSSRNELIEALEKLSS